MKTDVYERGLELRRQVLGNDYVDRALASADALTAPLQELVTEYCWGRVWGCPGLDRRIRSLLNVAMLAALNTPHELRLHITGALNNGVTKEEIFEACCRPPSIAVRQRQSTASG